MTKSIFILLSLFFSISSFAMICEVESHYTELTSGMNKSTICNDTISSLRGNINDLSDDAVVLIEANGGRQTYSVELTSIKLIDEGEIKYSGTGRLHWYPGDSYVILYK